jgi:predicted DsbA family dithiol-disulfide isomerase
MNLPLAVHPNALRAAQAGQCASDQGAFWKMFDMMQTNPQQLEMSNLITYAKKIGLDISAFRECVESRKYEDRIQGAARDAERMGARGTPAFVIGKSTPNGVDGSLFIGAQDYSFFDKILKAVQ